MNNWQKVKIKDVTNKVVDNRGKTPKNNTECGIPLLEVNALTETKKTPTYEVVRKYVDTETYNNAFRSGHPQKGDILIPTVGTIGNVCMADNRQCCIAQNVIGLRINKDLCVPEYLYYTLKNKTTQRRLLNLDIGGVQPSIKVPHLLNLEIFLPDFFTQKKIAYFLSSLDDKIELNAQINHNLEEQAKAIFKSWFVDFEPFGYKAPCTWESGILGDFVEIKRGGSPRPIQNYLSNSGLRWLKISDATACPSPFLIDIKEHIKESGLSKTVLLNTGALVLSNSATPGIPKILDVDSCIHDGWLYFPKSKLSNEFLFLFFKHIRSNLVSLGNGSVLQI